MAQDLEQMDTATFEPAERASSPRLVRAVWEHKALVLLGLGIGLTLASLYYVQAKPAYMSSTQLLVIKKRPDMPTAGSDARTLPQEDYLSTHEVLIRSPLIVGQAIELGKLRGLRSFEGREDPMGTIIGSLKITREVRNLSSTNILNITFRGAVAEDCGVVLNALTDSYRRFLNKTYQNVSDETAQLITHAKEVLETRLTKQEEDYRQFKLKHPLLWKGKDGVNVLQERLFTIEAKRSGLRIRQAEIEGSLAVLERALKEGVSRAELLAMVSQSVKRLGPEGGKTNPLDDPLTVLKLQEQTLLEEYGPDYPKVQAVRARMAFLVAESESSAAGKFSPLDPVQAHLQMLRGERDDVRTTAESLAKLLVEEQEQAKKLVGDENQDAYYLTEISRSQQLFESIAKRLQEVNLLKDFGGYDAETISPAAAGGQVAPKAVPIFLVGGFLGLLAGLGLAYLADFSDKSFRSPEEIRRLGLPVVGHIPYFKSKEAEGEPAESDGPQLSPTLCTVHRSKSREAEAYRGVRTALYFNNRGQRHQVIQVTSPDMGDGKTTLAANLAVSIAQSGKQILLLDADCRRPRIHKLFDIPSEQGLVSVLAGEAELLDVIQPSAIPGLSLLPCGPVPDNPAELLSQPRFQEALAVLREQYDFVVIDTPPLLAVTDPCVVVPYVDSVLLTIRLSKNARPHAQRAKEILSTLGGKILGVVVNGLGRNTKGYGYDNYRYGYGYKAYNYSNEEDKHDAYYSPSDAEGDGQQAANGTAAGERKRTAASRESSHRKGRGLLRRLFNF